ncbi:uncharacterized protein ARMOST_15782 [Armillaria ostoyae]|uniref:Uncharacterized protein n=1 Tax=Armillaria ostoyae TaxID=47428 RepID=A0A284RUB6_ARMOS|nr:uncharacterized protein ARMOST_15782 [Armillaria ostoyae]
MRQPTSFRTTNQGSFLAMGPAYLEPVPSKLRTRYIFSRLCSEIVSGSTSVADPTFIKSDALDDLIYEH